MQVLFWLALAFVTYTYAAYPILVKLVAQLRANELGEPASVDRWPSVCVLVCVHNETARVQAKVDNLRALDYPAGNLRILFVSDGSTDGTDDSVLATGVDLVRVAERQGKAHALNVGCRLVREEIIVFTDVRQMLTPGSVRYLLASLLRPGIGAVSGELVHRDPVSRQSEHIGLYWRYEKLIRKAESRIASTAGATGALYAVRRKDVVTIPDDTLLDDFEIPIALVRRRLRVLFDPRAVIYDELQKDSASERRRKIRTLAGNFQSFFRNGWLFVPFRNPIWWQFLSHKAFRLLVPYGLLLVLGASLMLPGYYFLFGLMQLAGYTLALVGMSLTKLREQRLVSFLIVFVELNCAAVLAFAQYVRGRASVKWDKT